MRINKIIIVGGGTSGWFTATTLAYKFPRLDITLIESREIPTIGVGESTLNHINYFFNVLDLEDNEWMKECDATYKASIEFENFYKNGTRFQYPFGFISTPPNLDSGVGIYSVDEWFNLKSAYPNEIKAEDFVNYFSFNGLLANYNRMANEEVYNFSFKRDIAYHFDAEKFAKFLQKKYCANVTHYIATIEDVGVSENGIEYVRVDDNKLTADLYIDCSGFNSLLIEQKLKVPFIEFESLINDSAIAARIPYNEKETIRNTTLCTAVDNGWIWNIPLWNRYGSGYVFSSKFADFDSIENEFRKKTSYEGDIKRISFRHGYHEKAFYKNVYTVGLSYGFIEPLESTGLLTVHENILALITLLGKHDCHINNIDKEMLNYFCETYIRNMSDFVGYHYAFSKKDDTDYWNEVTNNISYNPIDLYQDILFNKKYNTFGGLLFILIGMNYSPTSIDDLKWLISLKSKTLYEYKIKLNSYKNILKKQKENILKYPSHLEFLKQKIYRT